VREIGIVSEQQTTPDSRLQELILHIAHRLPGCDVHGVCAVLFEADIWAYSDAGTSVSGQEYEMRSCEPVPCELDDAIWSLIEIGELEIRDGTLVPLREPCLECLNDTARAYVDVVLQRHAA
jgi:hypothetical protein